MTDGLKRRAPELDARLQAAFEMTPVCDWCADIGADHGRLSARLLSDGRARHMLVADVSEKALSKARARLAWLGLESRAVLAVADGLEALRELPSGASLGAICILGMGGDTIAGILRRGAALLGGATLILSPHTEREWTREAVQAVGYRFEEEKLVQEAGRTYVLMRAVPARDGEPPYTEEELLLGPCLIKDRSALALAFWKRRAELLHGEIAAMERANHEKDADRLARSRRELQSVEEMLERASKYTC